jgi:hypothetical protein
MASPCIITFKGKKYSFEEFAGMLHDGLLDQMVQDGIVDDSRFKKMATSKVNEPSLTMKRMLNFTLFQKKPTQM